MPRWTAQTVFFTALVILIICASCYVDTSDADASIETARALISRGSLRVELANPDFTYYSNTSENCCYSKMGWVHPILYAPFIGFVRLFKLSPSHSWRVESFLLSMINPFLTAFIVLILFLFFKKNLDSSAAGWLSLGLSFGSLLFPYSKTAHREPLQALLLCYVFYRLSDTSLFDSLPKVFSLISAGIILLLSKQAMLFTLIPGILYAFTRIRRERPAWTRIIILAILVGGGGIVLLNRLIFGTFMGGGYGQGVFRLDPHVWSTPFWLGLHQQITSLDTGIIIHNPWVILVPWFLIHKLRRHTFSSLDVALIATVFMQAMFYAKWYSPIGREALGPRYLVAVLPIVILLMSGFSIKELKRAPRLICYGLLGISLLLQGVNTSVKMQQYWTFQSMAGRPHLAPHWLFNAKVFLHKLKSFDEIYDVPELNDGIRRQVDFSGVQSLNGFNFWWLHLTRIKTVRLLNGKGLDKISQN